jgi:hypothetical protein
MPIPIIPIITGLFSIGKTWIDGMTKRRNMKIASKTKQMELKLQLKEKIMTAQVAAEIDLDKINTESMANSWKDEFLLLLFSVPVIMCFIPGLAMYVTAGFVALSGTPVWYQVIFVVICLTIYGHRKLAKLFAAKFMGEKNE